MSDGCHPDHGQVLDIAYAIRRHDADGRDLDRRMCGAFYWTAMLNDGFTPEEVASAALDGFDLEDEQAPRIDLKAGDSVGWPTAGRGTVAHVFDAIDNTRIAVVHVAGWWTTPDGYLTRRDTGVPAALEIVAVDLRRGEP